MKQSAITRHIKQTRIDKYIEKVIDLLHKCTSFVVKPQEKKGFLSIITSKRIYHQIEYS